MTFDEYWDKNWKKIINSDSGLKELLRLAFDSGQYSLKGERDHYISEAKRLDGIIKGLRNEKIVSSFGTV